MASGAQAGKPITGTVIESDHIYPWEMQRIEAAENAEDGDATKAFKWQNQTGRIPVRRRGDPERISARERYGRMTMAVNHKLTNVVKDRVVQNFQLNALRLNRSTGR
jgi:hypothetical protein